MSLAKGDLRIEEYSSAAELVLAMSDAVLTYASSGSVTSPIRVLSFGDLSIISLRFINISSTTESLLTSLANSLPPFASRKPFITFPKTTSGSTPSSITAGKKMDSLTTSSAFFRTIAGDISLYSFMKPMLLYTSSTASVYAFDFNPPLF